MYAANAFTVVTSLERIAGDSASNYLRAQFKVYRLNTDDHDKHGIGREQYALSAAEAAKLADKGSLYEAYEGTALIEDREEYWLIDYGVSEE